MDVQFTRKLGCEVTVLSTSDSKREDTIKLGAHEFIVTKGKETEVAQKVDVLMMVANIKPDKWEEYIPFYTRGGNNSRHCWERDSQNFCNLRVSL